MLKISKGNDIFYFGNKNAPSKFDKKDIAKYTTIRIHNHRNPTGGFAVIKIEFKDGTEIKIPNIFVDYLQLEDKLHEYSRIDEKKIPFLKK